MRELCPSVCMSSCRQEWCSHDLAPWWPEPLCTHCWVQLHLGQSQLFAMQCQSLALAPGGYLLAMSSNLWVHLGQAGRGRHTTVRWEAVAQPHLQCLRTGKPGSLAQGTYHTLLLSHLGLAFLVGGFHCNLSINHPFLQMLASFPLCSRDRDRGQTRGELPQGRGQKHDHAGWPCTSPLHLGSWSSKILNT